MMMMINDHCRSLNPCLVCQMLICTADGVDGNKNGDRNADDNDVHYDEWLSEPLLPSQSDAGLWAHYTSIKITVCSMYIDIVLCSWFFSLSWQNYLWMVTGRWTLVLNGGCNSIIRILGHLTCKTNIKIIWCTPYYQKKMNKNPCFFLHIFSSWCFLHKHFVSSSSTLLILNLFLLYRCIDLDAIWSIWYKQCAKGGLRGCGRCRLQKHLKIID